MTFRVADGSVTITCCPDHSLWTGSFASCRSVRCRIDCIRRRECVCEFY